MLNADMAMWHACAVAATWHAGMRIVLVSTHLPELDQIQSRKQSGLHADQPVIHPQRLNQARRHYENGGMKMRAHLEIMQPHALTCMGLQNSNDHHCWFRWPREVLVNQ